MNRNSRKRYSEGYRPHSDPRSEFLTKTPNLKKEMSFSSDHYITSRFTLKDDAAVERIKKIVSLLAEGNALRRGWLSDDADVRLDECGHRAFQFFGYGFCDSGPEICASALEESGEEGDDEDGCGISLFDEIQENLAADTWFFVENQGGDGRGDFCHYVAFYHQDGRFEDRHSDDLKKQILEAHNLSETDIA